MSLQISLITSILTLMLLPVAVLAQDAINLRQSVTVTKEELASGSLPLERIASIQGNIPQKVRLIQIPIDMQGGEVATLALSTVRTAIESLSKAGGGEVGGGAGGGASINFGRIAMAGSVCTIRMINMDSLANEQASSEQGSVGQNVSDEAGNANFTGATLSSTLRASVEAKLSSIAGAPIEKLKLTFDQRDEEILQISTQDRSVVIVPGGGGERIPLQVRIYEAGQLVQNATIRVSVLVLREVCMAREPINRGTMVSLEHLDVQEQWLPLSATAVSPSRAVGMALRSRIGAGELISQKDLEPSIAVKKGDLVTLVSLMGGVEVRTTGRAQASAREGDVILFETLQWKTRVSAKVSSPGFAMVLGAVEKENTRKPAVVTSMKK